jgi:hypothetical protein
MRINRGSADVDASHRPGGYHRSGGYLSVYYRHLLQPLAVSVPTFYGAYTNGMTGDKWLTLEHLENSVTATKMPKAAAVVLAASWNVLCRSGIVNPIDWESAAIAAGEIDVASLTGGWPTQIARQLQLEYQQAGWHAGAPGDFELTLGAARLYLHAGWAIPRPATRGRLGASNTCVAQVNNRD